MRVVVYFKIQSLKLQDQFYNLMVRNKSQMLYLHRISILKKQPKPWWHPKQHKILNNILVRVLESKQILNKIKPKKRFCKSQLFIVCCFRIWNTLKAATGTAYDDGIEFIFPYNLCNYKYTKKTFSFLIYIFLI